ncbi:nucleoside hydrolase [Streptomyces xanthophaeus]|uniref:nucleoside hydrolase n=1 Tax=Streptomyces xanthophaeus TaxID=67385 RepID=UPI003417EBEA
MPTPIILDCDPGHDDAMAILLAVGDPRVDLLAVTTSAGNQTIAKTALNARRMCALAKAFDVPVAAGYPKPLTGPLLVGDDVHGETGLDGWDFPEPAEVPLHSAHAVDLIHSLLTDSPEPLTLVVTGPQTNIAGLLALHPEDRHKIKEIVCMGGATHRGNTLPYSEYNILVDPEAAHEVLVSGVPMTYCGLNVTHQAPVTREVLGRILDVGTHISKVSAALLEFRSSTYDQIWDLPDAPLHDPVAIARVLDPTLVECVQAPVSIELRGEFTRGATVIDLYGVTGREPNALVATRLDTERFWDVFMKALAALG